MALSSETDEAEADAQAPFRLDELKAFIEAKVGRSFDTIAVSRRDVSSSSDVRTFWQADLDAGGRASSFHLKCQPGRGARHDAVDDLMRRRLERAAACFPRYWGQFETDGRTVRLWDHCEGESQASFHGFSPEQLAAVIDAVAEVESRSGEGCAAAGAAETGVAAGMRWIEPTAERLREFAPDIAALGLAPHLALWSAIEPVVLGRLTRPRGSVLCHNDLKAPNVILTADGGVQIVDWDSASIGPHGASLRVLSRARKGEDRLCAERYAAAHAARGTPLDAADVLFVMHAQEIFWALNTGLERRRVARIATGLRHVSRAFDENGALKMTDRPRPAPEPLKAAVREFMERNGGKLYMPIPHPDFEGWPSSRKPLRQQIIAPHVAGVGGTALDIGTHFGTFAHWLEDLGFDVTAVEVVEKYAKIAEEIRDLSGKKFKVLNASIFEIEQREFDVVLALNIFHHFLKTKARFTKFETFLGELKSKVIIFQSHWNEEKQMEAAYRNFQQEEFVDFIAGKTGLTEVTMIGAEKNRKLFKLSRPGA